MPDYYGTASGFHAYVAARGLGDAHPDSAVQEKLLVASEWLDARYRSQFPGRKTGGRSQVREWPRTGASDNEGYAIVSTLVPTEVENATYEAARRELTTEGTLSTDYTPNKYQSASVSGAVAVTYTNFNTAQAAQVQLQIVDEILTPVLTASGGNWASLSGGACR